MVPQGRWLSPYEIASMGKPQPPIAAMDRQNVIGLPERYSGLWFLSPVASLKKEASTSSEQSRRKTSFKSNSESASKQGRKRPWAVRRRRLQEPQWCWLMGLINPNSPANPGGLKMRAGPAVGPDAVSP